MSEKIIKRVAIIGSGQMGAGIGMEFARFGYNVCLQDMKTEVFRHAMQAIREDLDLMVETALITAAEAETTLGRIRTTGDMADAVKEVDHVVEAVSENLSIKQQVFAQLDELCPPDVSLASNSSTLRAEDCAAHAKNYPERILLTHYWYPAPFIPLVEVIGGKRTAPEVLERVAGLLRSMHKKVVLQQLELQTGPAGWGNALQHPIEEVMRKMVIDKGCDPRVVDDLIRYGFGRRLPFTGIFLRYDVVGLDSFGKVLDTESFKPLKERVERGELGVKSGKGFYDWPGDSAKQYTRRFNTELIHLMKQDMERGEI